MVEAASVSRINRELSSASFIAYTPVGYSPFQPMESELWLENLRTDLSLLRKTWSGLVTYGVKGQLAEVPAIAADVGFKKLLLGVYNIKNTDEIDSALELARRYPRMIRAVCLGNEGLVFGRYTLDELESVFEKFRAELPDVLLTTSEPIFIWGEKRLLDIVDFCSPIIHPWIHTIFNADPYAAAIWVIQAAQRLQILSGCPVFIKETGFPAEKDLFPPELQAKFWRTLYPEIGALTRNVHLATFEGFDNDLKTTYSTNLVWDKYWGIFTQARTPKPSFHEIANDLNPPQPRCEFISQADVSVVITAKDRPHFLGQAIESVLEQKDNIRELILVDDNSADSCMMDVYERYRHAEGVRILLRKEPGSSGTARNEGLKSVRSEYVCFLDDDDYFLPGKISEQLSFLSENPGFSGVGGSAILVDEEDQVVGRSGRPEYFQGMPLANMLAFCQFINSSMMLKTSDLREVGGYLEFFKGEDWELWCRLLARGKSLHSLNRPLVAYRRHESNISNLGYIQEAARNVLEVFKDVPSERLASPLDYQPSSGELLKGTVFLVHGQYEKALRCLSRLEIPVAKLARHACLRELGEYDAALLEIEPLISNPPLLSRVRTRLTTHQKRYRYRRNGAVVGSAALLLEQRLLARDVTAATTSVNHSVNLELYFCPNPSNINIEEESEEMTEELFFSRVSLHSC